MDQTVKTTRRDAMGIVTLNRPAAINALTLEMIEAVTEALAGWRDDAGIAAVLIEGEGEKGFCAGGDVRAVREKVLAGDLDGAKAFFAAEYALNALIATYEKPVVALQTGIVMGGGLGLSAHARYRVSTPSSRFAMPEGGIGFFSDVGVNAILAQALEHRALAFLLSGASVPPADAIALGLSDTMVPEAQLADVRARLIDAARANEVDTAMAAVLQGEGVEPGEAVFCAAADRLQPAFDLDGPDEIVDALRAEGSKDARDLAERMERHSPQSLWAIWLSHRLARSQRDVRATLESDLRLASHLITTPDFAEGVRAVLVDKDRAPRWTPDGLEAVDVEALAKILD